MVVFGSIEDVNKNPLVMPSVVVRFTSAKTFSEISNVFQSHLLQN